ncbi:MAG: Ig-like domain-containing protein [Chloroflexota bacterium]|nr:Ig-like domain-containing protein [Chloroflexota bacterium]
MGRLREREQEKIRELVSAYLDGELSPDDAQFVGKRIQEDPAYAQVYAAYRGIRMDLRALTRPEVPASVSQTIRARAAVMQPGRAALNIRQRVARITAAAATLAATFAAILTGGFGLPQHFSHAVPGTGQSNQIVSVSTSNAPTTAVVLNPNIRFDQSAEIRFTRPMNEQTVLTSVAFSPTVAVSNLQYDTSTSILSTKPKTLVPQTTYTVQIPAGLKDAEGNDVTPGAFSFSVSNIIPGSSSVGQPTTVPATAAASPTPLTIAAAPTVVTATAAPAPAPTTVSAPAPATTEATAAPLPATDTTVATEPPVAPTATARPAPAKPANTPVPAPASKPAGTVIAIVEPTAVPTVIPTVAPTAPPAPTIAPTATPAPTVAPTATVVPTATAPAIAVADKFKGAYAATANRLGSPISAATSVGTSQLFFQNGFMVYAAGQPIYVFYTGDRSYAAYPNPGNSGAGSEGGAGPSAGLYKPVNAFGVVWTAQKLQSKLGYATSPGEAGGSGTIQTFENGAILSVGNDVYVLLKSGAWQPFSG